MRLRALLLVLAVVIIVGAGDPAHRFDPLVYVIKLLLVFGDDLHPLHVVNGPANAVDQSHAKQCIEECLYFLDYLFEVDLVRCF